MYWELAANPIEYIMKKVRRSALFILVLSITPFLGFSQTKLDTVYYDSQMKVVTDTTLAETYEIRFKRKGKLHGIAKRFNWKDEVVETTTYEKGKKTGPYMLIKGDTTITGTFVRNRKIDLWTFEHTNNSGARIEMYDKKGRLTELDAPIISESDNAITLERDAGFPGGPKAWNLFLRNNLRYPAAAKNAKAEGQVILKFIVTSTGSLKDVVVASNPNQDLSLEALRVLRKAPKWIPKQVEGKAVDSEMTLRVVFRLPKRR